MYEDDDYAPQLYYDEFPNHSREPNIEHSFRDQFGGRRAQAQNPEGLRQRIGLGPAPANMRGIARSTSLNVPATSFGNTSYNSGARTSSFQTPHDGFGPLPTSDLPSMLAAMSLQQTRLGEQSQFLAQENAALKARVAAMETAQPHPPPVADVARHEHSDPRIAAVALKKKKRAPRKERLLEPFPLPPSADAGSCTPQIVGDYLGHPNLPLTLVPVRTAVQKFVSKTFREVCDVPLKSPWPDPDLPRLNPVTGEVYLTPRFALPVTDPRNRHLISVVGRAAHVALQDKNLRPDVLIQSKASWDLTLLDGMAQNSFTNFRPQWKRQHNPEAAAKAKINERTNRWKQRRILKLSQMKSVVRAYCGAHNLDPVAIEALLHEDHLSDEASGPEDGGEESFQTWKVRMASMSNIPVTSRSSLDKVEFIEVLTPGWRAELLSNLFHGLHQLWFESLTPGERNTIRYTRVRDSGRSSQRVPVLAPWDFGISTPWLDANRYLPGNETLLGDWGTFGNPPWFDPSLFNTLANPTALGTAFSVVEEVQDTVQLTVTMGVAATDERNLLTQT